MHWQTLFDVPDIPSPWLPWLANADSMTQILEEISGVPCQISVQHEGWQTPWADESHCLHLASAPCFVREVVINVRRPALFARAVFPKEVIDSFPELLDLGSNPLGKFIFSKHKLRRGIIEIAETSSGNALWERIPVALRSKTHWARRSSFRINNLSFLLSEVFFPYVATL